MKRREILALLAASLPLAGCWRQTHVYRQKLTVVVSTPAGEKSGSAVTEVTVKVGQLPMSGNITEHHVRGEATVVDLGNGKYLFALLSSGGAKTATAYWARRAFASRLMENTKGKSEENLLNAYYTALLDVRDTYRFTPDQYPLLVTFKNINDPKSVLEVKPDRLADVFGAGFALRAITLEITDEAVADGLVEKVLPFLSQQNPIFIDWKKYPIDHPLQSVSKLSFRNES